ncbi:MAG: hypothetical protein AAGI66_05635 [Cyanobacteria bacterium P01_H01_bin.74]
MFIQLLSFAIISSGLLLFFKLPLGIALFAGALGAYAVFQSYTKVTVYGFFIAILAVFYQFSPMLDNFTNTMIGISFKTASISMALLCIYALWCLYKKLPYLLQFLPFKLLGGFLIATLIYYFLPYASDFNITASKSGYPIAFESSFGSFDAKFIVLLTAVGLFLAYTTAVSFFKPSQKTTFTIEKQLSYTSIALALFGIGCVVFYLLSRDLSSGMVLFLPTLMTLFVAFKALNSVIPSIVIKGYSVSKHLPILFDVLFTAIFILLPLIVNKSGLLGVAITFIFYFYLIKKFNLNF